MFGRALVAVLLGSTAFAANAPAAAPESTAQQHPLTTHSIPPSAVPSGVSSSWQCSGSCQALPDGSFNLLNGMYGVQGVLWNPIRLDLADFTLEATIKLSGVMSDAADGFGLWLTNSTVIDELARFPLGRGPWTLAGHANQFGGWGVVFGTRDRNDDPRQSVSLLSSRGRGSPIDPIKGIPSGYGIYWPYKQPTTESLLLLKLVSSGDDFTGLVRYAADKDWQKIFSFKKSAEGFGRHRGYFLLTASNSRQSKKPIAGMSVTIQRMSIQVDAANSLSPRTSVSNLVDHARNLAAEGNIADSLTALIDILAEHVIPSQHGMEYSVLQGIDTAIKDMKNSWRESSVQYMNELQAIRHKLDPSQGLEEIKENAQNLESSVRAATSRVHLSTMVLGCLFVGFGVLIYKRMTDIEKKHYL